VHLLLKEFNYFWEFLVALFYRIGDEFLELK
jgi:hypothetical protein